MRVSATNRLYHGWVMVGALSLTEIVSWGVLFYAFSALLVPMQKELGWSRTTLSAGMSVALLVAGLAAPFAGVWLDRRGARLLMTAGSVLAALSVLAWSRVESLPAYFAVFIAIGLAMAATFYEPAFAVVATWFERKRNRALLVISVAGGFASTIFIPLTDRLVGWFDWRTALVILAAILAVVTIPAHGLLLRRRPEDFGMLPDGHRPDPAGGGGPAAEAAARPDVVQVVAVPGVTVREAMRDATFWWLAVAFVLSTLATVAVTVHLVAFLLDEGYAPAFAAAVAGAHGALSATGRVVITAADRILPRSRSGSIVVGLQMLALVALLVWRDTPGVILFTVLFGASVGAMTITRAALLADYYGRASYGAIAGVMAMFQSGARTLAPVGVGFAYGLADGYDPVFWGRVAATGVATSAMVLAERTQERRAIGRRAADSRPVLSEAGGESE